MTKYFIKNIIQNDESNILFDKNDEDYEYQYDLDDENDEKQVASSFLNDFEYKVINKDDNTESTIWGSMLDHSICSYDEDYESKYFEIMDATSDLYIMTSVLLSSYFKDDYFYSQLKTIAISKIQIHNNDEKLFKTIIKNIVGIVWSQSRFFGQCVTFLDSDLEEWQKPILKKLGFKHYKSKKEREGIYIQCCDDLINELGFCC